MAIVGVSWDAWQMECCGDPFRVGHRVEWSLHLIPRGTAIPESAHTTFTADVVRMPMQEKPEGWQPQGDEVAPDPNWYGVSNGDLHALWCTESEPLGDATAGRIEVSGLLYEDHHAMAAVKTVGIVRRIWVESFRLRSRGERSKAFDRVPSTRSLYAVNSSPKWFAINRDPDPDGFVDETGEFVSRSHTDETGMFVQLTVATELPVSPPSADRRS
ncbi:MAG: DUF6578 domain-containing protein [Mycobacteriales bacterium]